MNRFRRLAIAMAAPVAVFAVTAAPVGATSTTSVTATGVYVDIGTTCPGPPAGFEDFTSYAPLYMTGELEGCWYTRIDWSWDVGAPSGLYFEIGREVFVGRLLGGRVGTFSTSYTFESRWSPDAATGKELWGHCQHTIRAGTGTEGLRGISGFLARTDVVADGSARYRGVVRQR